MSISAIVAGTHFYAPDVIRNKCADGASVRLVREPRNKYDANAIAVYLMVQGWFWLKPVKIGHLKAPLAKRLAPKMDAGTVPKVKVVSFWAPEGIESPRVSIEIVV